jgi:hypothetical protein
VDRLDHVGAGDRQVVVAAFPALAAEVLGAEFAGLQLGAHRAVEKQNAVTQRV